MNLQLQALTPFGHVDGLKDFFFVHRLVHDQVDAVIAVKGQGNMPNATLDSQRALDAWVKLMQGEEADAQEQEALTDWLQLHANLHQAEYSALHLGVSPDLGVVDFAQESQYYDWQYAHSAVHDTLGQATGVV